VAEIREHMKIVGKDGAPVGTVDRVEGDRIKLTRKDSPEGHHRRLGDLGAQPNRRRDVIGRPHSR
jgi:hypothetical protein